MPARDSRHRGRADAPDHGGIHRAHQHDANLGEHDRPREPHHFAKLSPRWSDLPQIHLLVSRSRQRRAYSHSIVAGGLELTSYTTLFTPATSLMIRLEIRASASCGNGNQSAVMPSVLVTARRAIAFSYVRKSPITPTERIGRNTANACQILS